jgi:hypothetical protein
MDWFSILKISTRDAIRDAERFAPDMIAEQKKLDREEKEEGIKRAKQASKTEYYIPPEQLPRIQDYRFAPKASKTSRGETTTNWDSFLQTYVPYFLTNEEYITYKKNKRDLYKYSKIFDESQLRPQEQELADKAFDENAEIYSSAIWRWDYFYHGTRFFEEGKEEGLKQEIARFWGAEK